MTALGALPFLALLLAGLRFAPGLGAGSLRRGWLRVGVAWAVFSFLSLELLSLFGAVRQAILLLLWVPVTAALTYSLIRRPPRDLRHKLSSGLSQATTGQWVVMAATAAVLALTALVAWLAPPNTWDSLNYHMPRVAHWAQLGAVRHFPTGIEIQNSMAPGAEMLILLTYVLGQSDRWANFVQWFAMVGGLVGVSLIARQLGAGRMGQWAAVAFAASLPTGIIQASSTMTDYVVAFFVVVAVSEVLALRSQANDKYGRSLLFAVLAAGLAVHTKPTAAVFLAPFAVLAAFHVLQGGLRREILVPAFAGLGLVLLVSTPHLVRNLRTYDTPVGYPGHIEQHRLPILSGRAPVSVLSRNLAAQMGTPSAHLNKGIARTVQVLHEGLGLDVNDPRTTVVGSFKVRFSSRNEDKATNPIHTWLILISLLLGLISRRLSRRWLELVGCSVLAFLLFSSAFKWNLFGGRLLHPLYVLVAPAVAVMSQRLFTGRWLAVGSLALMLAGTPWLLQIKSRPLLTWPGETYVGSVLTMPRERLYFSNGRYLEDPYTDLVAGIQQRQCRSVRLRLPGIAAEYPLWTLLDAPRSGVRIGWSVADSPSAGIAESLPPACAVICHDCPGGQTTYGELALESRQGGYSLYLAH